MYTCKHCSAPLEVDEEYMQSTYGAAWTYMKDEEKSWFCINEVECGEAGLFEEMTDDTAKVYG